MRNSLDPHKLCCANIRHSMQSKQEKAPFIYIYVYIYIYANPLKQGGAENLVSHQVIVQFTLVLKKLSQHPQLY